MYDRNIMMVLQSGLFKSRVGLLLIHYVKERRRTRRPDDRLDMLLQFQCAEANRKSALKFTLGDEYRVSAVDTS